MSDHYCITTKSGLKTYFSRKKRVSKVEFYKRHPNFDERKCILIQHKEKIKQDIDNLTEIKKEIGEYKEKLNRCIENENKENSKILSLKQEVSGCENRIVKYKKQIEDLTLLSQKHKNQLKNLEISNKNYNKEIEEKIKVIESLNNDILSNKLNIDDLNESLKLFEIQNIDLRNQLKECTQYFNNFKDELSSLLDIYDISDDNDLKKEILKQIEQLNEKIVLAESHKKQLEDIIKSKEEEILNLKEENKQRLEQLKNELGDVESKNTTIIQLQQQLSESNKIIEDLQSYLKDVINSDEVNIKEKENKDDLENKEDIVEDLKKVMDNEKALDIYQNLYSLENIDNIIDIENKEELKIDQPYEGFYDYFIKKMKKIASYGNKEIDEKVEANFKNITQTKQVENVKKEIKKKLKTSWLKKFKPIILSSAAAILGAAASQSLLPTNQHISSVQNLPKISNISTSMSFLPPQLDSYKFEEKVEEMLKNQPKNVTEIVDKVIESLPKKEYLPKTNFEFSDLFDLGDDPFESLKSLRNFASTVSKYTPSISQYLPSMKNTLNTFKINQNENRKDSKYKIDTEINKGKCYIGDDPRDYVTNARKSYRGHYEDIYDRKYRNQIKRRLPLLKK